MNENPVVSSQLSAASPAVSAGVIRQLTEIPGPRSRELMARRDQAVPRSFGKLTPIFIRRASGAIIEDVDGNTYIDFAGGIGCLNVGSTPPDVVHAIQHQAGEFIHASGTTPYELYLALAERLNKLTPGDFEKRTFLVNSGAEGVENAIKLARHYTGRHAIVAFEDAFHGRTLLGVALTSKAMYKSGFGPTVSDVYRVPYAYCYRCAYGGCELGEHRIKGENTDDWPAPKLPCVGGVENLFKRYVPAENVAAVIIEPVIGEGGFIAPPRQFMQQLQEICRARGIVLIADEVQSGIARTGTMYACEQLGLEPDLIISAKSLGAGLPIAAVTGRAEIMDHPSPGGIGSTFGGNPVACSAALAVLDQIERENLCERAREIGARVMNFFREQRQKHDFIGDVRGLGAMVGVELVKDKESREPDKERTDKFTRMAYERGLITITAGNFGNVIRTLMPLVITDEQLDAAFAVMAGIFAEIV
ncbi:MAG TPA: 4-aminobutyrate--2-oxoglutarate transaminase [Blastocatellia bacterium]|nr:4-aminobutyrate--2-oxoglutarate transaminase [Blastocatellia bacterium]